jgi:hypothetical protein
MASSSGLVAGAASANDAARGPQRPITLVATADQPLTYAQANTLAAMAAVPGATYTLSLTLKSFSALVMFDWSQGPALDLSLVIDYADPATTDPVSGTLHLLTV